MSIQNNLLLDRPIQYHSIINEESIYDIKNVKQKKLLYLTRLRPIFPIFYPLVRPENQRFYGAFREGGRGGFNRNINQKWAKAAAVK